MLSRIPNPLVFWKLWVAVLGKIVVQSNPIHPVTHISYGRNSKKSLYINDIINTILINDNINTILINIISRPF